MCVFTSGQGCSAPFLDAIPLGPGTLKVCTYLHSMSNPCLSESGSPRFSSVAARTNDVWMQPCTWGHTARADVDEHSPLSLSSAPDSPAARAGGVIGPRSREISGVQDTNTAGDRSILKAGATFPRLYPPTSWGRRRGCTVTCHWEPGTPNTVH